MRTKNVIYICTFVSAMLLLTFTQCKKKKSDPDPTQQNEATWTSSGNSTVSTFLKTLAQAPASANIPASGGSISQNGITVDIPSGLFKKQDGTNYNGVAQCLLYTMTDIEDMIHRRGSTISPSGDLLISSGMFKLEAKDTSGNPLSIRAGATYSAVINSPYDTLDDVFRGTISAANGGQITWNEWPNTQTDRGPTGPGSTRLLGLNDTEWCNLDRYMNDPNLTHLYVTLPDGFTSSNSEVVIRYVPDRAVAYLPANPTLKKFTTDGSSYKVVQGRTIKVLALAKKDNKYYYKVETIPSINANHELVITSMTETTETDFKNQISNF
ncbi:MAG: hypothetical protein NZ529_04860 [Cytophagaceae bacterium]|nr:hypothetical protein [Cytophagaceae bacterium]MDW8456105.1 hypothetical protein [Cytophagaceae bacterium]